MDYQSIINTLALRGFTAEETPINKDGRTTIGLRIDTGTIIQPVFYPSDIPNVDKMSNDQIVDEIISLYDEVMSTSAVPNIDTKLITDPAYILCHCYIGLCSTTNLSDNVMSRPSSLGADDIHEYVYYTLPTPDPKHEVIRITILNDMPGLLHIDESEFWRNAYENTISETQLIDINDYMAKLTGLSRDEFPDSDIVLITNKNHHYGAGAILNKTVIEEYAKMHNVDTVICLPASVHEWILVPGTDDTLKDPDAFLRTISEGNQFVVDKEILGVKPLILTF